MGQTILQQPIKRKIKAKFDIVFCVDATGSMQPCIDQLKNNMQTFVDSFLAEKGQTQFVPDWRARVIAFRDIEADGEEFGLEGSNPFVSDVHSLKNQIERIEAKGGGDTPENILDALYVAITKSDWREGVLHVVIAFTDAPPKQLHASTVEPGQARDVSTVIQAFSRDKFQRLWVFCPRDKVYEELSFIPKSQIIFVDEQGSDVYTGLKNINFSSLLSQLAKTISISAGETIVYQP